MSTKLKIFDSDALINFHKRIFFSIIVFSCFYFIAVFRITDIMVINSNNIELTQSILEKNRGKIYDRNGYLLSTNIKNYSLFANTLKINKKNELSQKLSLILNLDNKLILNKLKTKKKFVYLKRNISPKEHKKIIELGEINIQTHKEIKRVYPFQNTASHFIGYVDIDNIGKAGIERSFNESLSNGKDIITSIDIHLQNAIQIELKKTIEKFKAESGTSIVMNIKNGEILALNNFPDFDPNNLNKANSNQLLNRALQSNYEMGSTFKPITVAMGIDDNSIYKDNIFDVSKPINNISDYHPFDGFLGIKGIIVKSSNIGTAKIAKKIGKQKQIKFFKKIGFFEPVKINLAEAAMPLGNKNNWGEIETMTIGFGHGFAITPMHLAVAYSSILNEGNKIDPKITLDINNYAKKRIIKKETSNYMFDILRAVITDTKYTGPRVSIEGYDIGGKTGTAELIDEFGKYDKNSNRTLFVGAFPMQNPRFLVLTIIDNPKKIKEENYSTTGATVNAPLVKNIILRMIEIMNIPRILNNNILNIATSINYNKKNAIN